MTGEEIRNEISFNSSFIYCLIIILTIMYEIPTIFYYFYNNVYYVFLLINIIGLYFICNRLRFEINISIKKI